MKILWIGGICWNQDGKYKFPLTLPGAVSGSFFQQSIIEGMESFSEEVEVTLLTEYCSNYKKIIPKFCWSHNGTSHDVSVSVIQVPFFNRISKTYNLSKAYADIFSKRRFDVAIVYNIHTPYLKTLERVKQCQPDIKSVLIVPDLIEYTDVDLKRKPIKKWLKKADRKEINRLYDLIDGFVLFTESMKEKLPIKGKPYVVIEGVYSPHGLKERTGEKKNAVMYAGSIPFGFGIENIVKAMDYLKDLDTELWIYGTGPMKSFLERTSSENPKIKYFGFVQRGDLFEYEQEASILINARNSDDEFTMYSFPSKTFEYLVSGTPFLTTMLRGIPKEYAEYLFVLENNTPKEIAKKIREIINMDKTKRDRKCELAKKYVVAKKNKYVQAEKLLELINKLGVNQKNSF